MLHLCKDKMISWGVASPPEGNSRGIRVQRALLCAECRLVNPMLSPYH